MTKKRNKILNLILPLVTIVAIFILWLAAAAVVNNRYLLPSITETFKALLSLFGEKSFYVALGGTLLRSLVAFIISFSLAFILAVIVAIINYAERIIAPVISILRALPTIAVVLLLLFWTNSKVAPVVVTLLVVLPTCYTHVKSAFDSVDNVTFEAALVDGADKKQGFLKIKIPQALPAIYGAMGSGLSLNLKLMVAAEVLSATANSLGYLLNTSKVYFEIATMIALVVVAVVIGCVIEGTFNYLSKRSGEWK